MRVSVGVLSRIYLGELPYLRFFIEHYLKLGVDHFYLVVPEPDDLDRLQDALASYRGTFELIADGPRNPEQALKIDVGRVKTDYFLSVDVDELVYLSGSQYLPQFIAAHDVATANLRWIMSPRDFAAPEGRITGFAGHVGKMLARTDLVAGIKGSHTLAVHEHIRHARYDALQLVHYWGRSWEDVVIKCLYSKFADRKRSSAAQMADLLERRQLPERLRLLASLTSHRPDVAVRAANHTLIDRALEAELLAVVDAGFLDELKAVYLAYKAGLDYDRHVGVYPACGSLYELGKLLP